MLLVGDSWGQGVFGKDPYEPIGQGIHTLLDGYDIINVSASGASNPEILKQIRDNINDVDAVLFLQTDAFRENSHWAERNGSSWKVLNDEFLDSLLNYSSLRNYLYFYFVHLYQQLNVLAKDNSKQIYCIGGWADLHPIINDYEYLIPIIPSATQSLIPEVTENVYLSDFEWFPQLDNSRLIKEKFGSELKQITLDSSKKFDLSCAHWNDVHPDLPAYQSLVKIIQNYLLRDK